MGLFRKVLACELLCASPVNVQAQDEQVVPEQMLTFSAVDKPEYAKSNLAVLLIDMQPDFLANINPEEYKRELPYQIAVLNRCKRDRIPVFQIEYRGHGKTVRKLREKVDGLRYKHYIAKSYDDAFKHTSLEEKLNRHRVKVVVLMGVNASACVRSTAYGALDADFKIMTSKDVIADDYVKDSKYSPNESIDWYKTNGLYFDSYKDLIHIISARQFL